MRLLYKPLGLVVSVLGGIVAGALFKRAWAALESEREPPEATDRDRSWREVVVAAAIQGAIFAGVKAVVERAGAAWFSRITGVWPGKTQTKHA
jgi:Protein of unknown function (DUF4235)